MLYIGAGRTTLLTLLSLLSSYLRMGACWLDMLAIGGLKAVRLNDILLPVSVS